MKSKMMTNKKMMKKKASAHSLVQLLVQILSRIKVGSAKMAANV